MSSITDVINSIIGTLRSTVVSRYGLGSKLPCDTMVQETISYNNDCNAVGVQVNDNKMKLPSKRSVEESLGRFDDFRILCQFQMEVGYRSTIDFPSKHHINKILQMQYRDKKDLTELYGEGLVERIFATIPFCKAYVSFVRETDDQAANRKSKQAQ